MNKFSIILFLITSLFSEEPENVVILGGGPAGLTAAIYAGQGGLLPLVVEGEKCEGQLAVVNHMENYPGFPEGISGDDLLHSIHIQAEKFGARFKSGKIIDVDLLHRPFRLTFSDGQTLYSHAVIIALGTAKRWIGLDSEKALLGKGVSGSAACEASLYQNEDVVVVGGGDAALEEVLALSEYAAKVTLIHRNNHLNASNYLQEKIFSKHNIQVILNSAVDEILDVSQNRVTGIIVRNLQTQERSDLPCKGVFVSIGRKPNIDLFKGQLEISASGHIIVHPSTSQTSIPGVFAAGDVCDPTYRKTITAAGFGCMAALDTIRYLLPQ